MAIAYKSAGAGAATQTSGAACSPASPAVVDAGDILIVHAYFEGTTTTPSTPAGFTALSGPHVIESTIGRHWVFGKIADGSEDGAANALGTAAVTTMRSGRCYSFSGRVAGSITDLVAGFAATSHATDPQMPSVTTSMVGALAVALVLQNDNNALAAATGMSGGTWAEAVAEFVAALTPGLVLQIQTCTPTANPGTVSGGSVAATNDPSGVVGFEIRPDVPAISATVSKTLDDATSTGEVDVDVVASVAKTLDAATAVGEADVAVVAQVAQTLEGATAAAEADVEVQAQAAPTLDAATVAATGTVEDGGGISGQVAQTLGAASSAAETDVQVQGAASPTLDAATAAGETDVLVAAGISATLDAAAASGDADVPVAGQTAAQLGEATAAGEADVSVVAQVGAQLGGATLEATGSTLADVQASVASQLGDAAVDATAGEGYEYRTKSKHRRRSRRLRYSDWAQDD